jgi:carboxylesterase type B
MQDQLLALKWIQNEIGAFGGDPNNVTIMGESAGGWNVGALLGSPAAAGLFHKVICQSGGAHSITKLESKLVANECTVRVLRQNVAAPLAVGSHAIDHELCHILLNGLNRMFAAPLLLDPTLLTMNSATHR